MRLLKLVCLIALGLLAAGPCLAGPSLGEVLFGAHGDQTGRSATPLVARFASDGGQDFVLDRLSIPPLMRFEDSAEIWVLQPQPGPRGDVIYKNDLGEPMLRATRLGGMTLFTPDHPEGAAAAFEGEAQPIRLSPIPSPGLLLQRLAQASARASRGVQRLVIFDAPDVTIESAALVADTAGVVAAAINDLAHHNDQRRGLARLNRVLLAPGPRPSVAMNDAVLRVVITPERGVAGRPSSRKIAAALGR